MGLAMQKQQIGHQEHWNYDTTAEKTYGTMHKKEERTEDKMKRKGCEKKDETEDFLFIDTNKIGGRGGEVHIVLKKI
jgi:hypothetical protein